MVMSHPSDFRSTLFYGEMVFPWMCEGDYAELSGFGMRELATPLYYLLHESIYADGSRPGNVPTDWAANRSRLARFASSPAAVASGETPPPRLRSQGHVPPTPRSIPAT